MSGTGVISAITVAIAIAAVPSTGGISPRRAATDAVMANVRSAGLASIPKQVAPKAHRVAATRRIALRIRRRSSSNSSNSSNSSRRRQSPKRPRRRKLQTARVPSAEIAVIVEIAAGAEVVAGGGVAAAEDAAVTAERKAAPRMPSPALKVLATTRLSHNRVQKRARKHSTASI